MDSQSKGKKCWAYQAENDIKNGQKIIGKPSHAMAPEVVHFGALDGHLSKNLGNPFFKCVQIRLAEFDLQRYFQKFGITNHWAPLLLCNLTILKKLKKLSTHSAIYFAI